MKLLLVGDPHFETRALDDCRALGELVCRLSKEHQVQPLFLGDQYDTHSIIHLEVQNLWFEVFEKLSKIHGSMALVGNHDLGGTYNSTATSMVTHIKQTKLIQEPTVLNGVLFVPYMHNPQEFVDLCNEYDHVPIVVCHQTFAGSTYENGFYAKDGVNPDLIPQTQIVSGHIHKPQSFGKVWYIGAPRWRTLSDANEDRAIWLVEFKDGQLIKHQSFDIGETCKRIYHFHDTPEKPLELNQDPRHEYRIDIRGPAQFIEQRKGVFGNARIRTFKTDKAKIEIKESEGIAVAFKKWSDAFVPPKGSDPQQLQKLLQERLS